MFVYCNNNPICCLDTTGDLTAGQIHDKVLEKIILDYEQGGYFFLSMSDTMIYYNGENIWNGWGFCDLYDKQTGEVWELKKDSKSYSCTTKYAKKQLGKYVNGRLASDRDLLLTRGGDLLFEKQMFTIACDHGTYDVEYWQECQGILRYSYKFNQKKNSNTQAVQKARLACSIAAVPLAIGAMALGSAIVVGGASATVIIPFAPVFYLAA